MTKLPCRLSYYPNQFKPHSFYTYVPHPLGKRHAVRRLFPFWGCEKKAMQRAVNFSNRKGRELWGVKWKSEGRLCAIHVPNKMKGRESPKAISVDCGVRKGNRKVERKNGKFTLHKYWTATWYENGVQRKKQFNYGARRTSEEARQLALEHRAKMVKLHYRE